MWKKGYQVFDSWFDSALSWQWTSQEELPASNAKPAVR